MPLQIFLSHSSLDWEIADALENLIRALFGKDVEVKYSSDRKAGGGIPPGADWLDWIMKEVDAAQKIYVLLTPNSINKSWVLWESGVAAGLALADSQDSSVTPITFDLSNDDIPGPFAPAENVRGDSEEGIDKLLHDLNQRLGVGEILSVTELKIETNKYLPDYFKKVQETLKDSAPLESLLGSLTSNFSVKELGGHWVTSYQFPSSGSMMHHAEVVQLTSISDRRLRGRTYGPEPRTEGKDPPFRNEIDIDLVRSHLIGHWKNINDHLYFGTIHLAVQPNGNVLQGYYTGYEDDRGVVAGDWKWVRINPETIQDVDVSKMVLREPAEIHDLLRNHKRGKPLNLADIVGKA